jgi:signal recognition particle GTPase
MSKIIEDLENEIIETLKNKTIQEVYNISRINKTRIHRIRKGSKMDLGEFQKFISIFYNMDRIELSGINWVHIRKK